MGGHYGNRKNKSTWHQHLEYIKIFVKLILESVDCGF